MLLPEVRVMESGFAYQGFTVHSIEYSLTLSDTVFVFISISDSLTGMMYAIA